MKDLWERIEGHVAAALKEGRPCMVCLAGNSGCGKSFIGKGLRKQGVGPVRPAEILVIDDGVASVPFLRFLRRRVAFRTREKDFLRPFERYFPGKKLVVYVNSQPTRRLDACDILVEVVCNEDLRQQRLRARNEDGDKRMADTAAYRLVKPRTRAELEIENDGGTFVLRPRAG